VILRPFPAFESLLANSILLAQGEGAPANPLGGSTFLVFIALVGLAFYFTVLLPGNKEKAERDKVRNELKKNDRIVTIGGIHGTVVSAPADGDEITIKLDENSPTRMRITRSAVQTVITTKDKDSKKDA